MTVTLLYTPQTNIQCDSDQRVRCDACDQLVFMVAAVLVHNLHLLLSMDGTVHRPVTGGP